MAKPTLPTDIQNFVASFAQAIIDRYLTDKLDINLRDIGKQMHAQIQDALSRGLDQTIADQLADLSHEYMYSEVCRPLLKRHHRPPGTKGRRVSTNGVPSLVASRAIDPITGGLEQHWFWKPWHLIDGVPFEDSQLADQAQIDKLLVIQEWKRQVVACIHQFPGLTAGQACAMAERADLLRFDPISGTYD